MKRCHSQQVLTGYSQELPAGSQDTQTRAGGEEAVRQRGHSVHEVLAVVQDEEEVFLAQVLEALKKLSKAGLSRSDEARDMLAVLGDEESLEDIKKSLEAAEEEETVRILGRVKRSKALASVFVKFMGDERKPVRIAASAAVLASTQNRK